jgi:anthranilate synthase component 1
MEIIDELEPTRRGPYAGATGYYGIDGRLDTCITLRTALLKEVELTSRPALGSSRTRCLL